MPTQHCLFQLYTHLADDSAEAARMAAEADPDAHRLGFRSLDISVARGDRLSFSLAIPRLEIAEPTQSIVWDGRINPVQFEATVPDGCSAGVLIGTVTIAKQSVPIGHIKFKLQIEKGAPAQDYALEPIGDDARRYELAFISYASQDRNKVLARVQMLTALGIGYFQDVLDLEPGDRWERRLFRHIDECDLFLLFWSLAASSSEWVLKEARYALRRKGDDDLAPPAIHPVIIEGPPVAKPPADLAHLYFGDRVTYFMMDAAGS
jgi:hypothetical protein